MYFISYGVGGEDVAFLQQDVAADEGMPNLRGKKAPEFTLRSLTI